MVIVTLLWELLATCTHFNITEQKKYIFQLIHRPLVTMIFFKYVKEWIKTWVDGPILLQKHTIFYCQKHDSSFSQKSHLRHHIVSVHDEGHELRNTKFFVHKKINLILMATQTTFDFKIWQYIKVTFQTM